MSGTGLHQNLSQSQVLAPQIRQSLEILQASTLDLNQLIQQSIEVNPCLESESIAESLDVIQDEHNDADMDTASQELYEDLRELAILQNRSMSSSDSQQEKREHMMNSLVGARTLQQHLMEQLELSLCKEELKDSIRVLIGDLDSRGYLETELSTTANQFSIPIEVLEESLAVLQRFTPSGVGAKDLQEALLIQLEYKLMQDSLEYEIVRLHLPTLAKKHFAQIARSLKCKEEDVRAAALCIAQLDPSPGSSFEGTSNPIVLPDLSFEKDESGVWYAALTNEYLPRLKINDVYKGMLGGGDRTLHNYLKEQIRDGRNLIKALDQRQETILAIGEEIILKQTDYLEKGFSKLHPLTMNDIADKIGIHATTVSRAVNGKYVRTPHGVVELRRFFSSGYTTKSGETVSNSGVRETIQKIIENEDKGKPLSDSGIEKLLKGKGLKVARRTIAKYREQLGILPSHLRKGF